MKSQQLKTQAQTVDTTILMIDPFPNIIEEKNYDVSKDALVELILPLISAMRNQLGLKQEEIRRVYAEDDYSRFMISPRREYRGIIQKQSLACGALDGFSGFFNKKFREHDYLLGRRNCQRFLKEHFCLPITTQDKKGNLVATPNPFVKAYKDLDKKELGITNPDFVPIIPDIRVKDGEIVKPAEEKVDVWGAIIGKTGLPTLSVNYLLDLEDKIGDRVEIVLSKISDSLTKKRFYQFLLNLVGNWLVKGRVTQLIIERLTESLRDADLLRND